MTTENLRERMAKADWYYDYTEDSSVWNRGRQEIQGIIKDLANLDPKTALDLWKEFVPPHSVGKPDFLNVKDNNMNENNLAFLEKQLTNLGFGDHMNAGLKANIEKELSEFNLQHTFNYGGKDMLVDLAFRRGDQNEMYFFNSFRATMKDDPNLSHTFKLNKGNAITSKEAFNLLQGRAVNKNLENREGEKYNAWVQLDIKGGKNIDQNFELNRYHTNYGFDLTKAMNELIIRPMTEKEDQDLYNSLKKGNVQSVTFLKEGEEVKGFIEANPKDKTIDIYDGHMKKDFIDPEFGKDRVKKEELNGQATGKDKEQKQEVKNKPGDDGDDGTLKKKPRAKKSKGAKL